MNDKFLITFNSAPSLRGAKDHAGLLGTSMVFCAPPPAIQTYGYNTQYPVILDDPYKTYFTLALPPGIWLQLAKNELPTPSEQIKHVDKIMIDMFLEKNHQLSLFYNFEYNQDLERLHIHGVICNIKNQSQLINFKQHLRKQLKIPPANRVAIKFYNQSKYHTTIDQLNYHLKGISYNGTLKDSPESFYHRLVRSDEASVGSEESTIN